LEKRVLILTGAPGVGKTTVLAKVVSDLHGKGVSVGGMFSREVREGTARVGFEVVDITGAKVGRLAHVNGQGGPMVGKYHVNLADLESVGVKAINSAIEQSDIVAIDEIGPMELLSTEFKQTTKKALESKKLLLVVVHQKARDKLIVEAKGRADAEVFVVTAENRGQLPEMLIERAVLFLKET
jgi:nucleoside-triphosphatase